MFSYIFVGLFKFNVFFFPQGEWQRTNQHGALSALGQSQPRLALPRDQPDRLPIGPGQAQQLHARQVQVLRH